MTLIFDISSVCLWEAPFAQRLSQRNKGKELLKKTPLLEDVMYFYILRMNFHLFKNHMDVESLQKTGISRMVGYQVVGCVLFFSCETLPPSSAPSCYAMAGHGAMSPYLTGRGWKTFFASNFWISWVKSIQKSWCGCHSCNSKIPKRWGCAKSQRSKDQSKPHWIFWWFL